MGLFNFARNAGEALRGALGGGLQVEDLKQALQRNGVTLQNLQLAEKGGVVTVAGVADSMATREKAILVLGNVKGVERVDERIQVVRPQAVRPTSAPFGGATPTLNQPATAQDAPPEPESRFYTVKPGDSLSKIAEQFYGSSNKYAAIFEANRPMLSDPDKIYPGQVLRIPPQH
jgi:nucleoid-associated protein YgaU